MVWASEHFQYKGIPLFYKHWMLSGIVFVKDLFNVDGTFLNEQQILQKLNP